MAFVYESALSKEFLKIVFDNLKSSLESLLKDRDEGPEEREGKTYLYRRILGPIFPNEMEKVREAIAKVVEDVRNEILWYGRRLIDALLRMLDEAQGVRKEASSATEAYGESIVQPFYRALKAMTRMQVEVADVFSSKSFLAAFLAVRALDERLSSLNTGGAGERAINVEVVEGEAPIIHSTWSRLAEKGTCLICSPTCANLDVEEICEALGDVGEGLSKGEELVNVHDYIATYLRSRERPSKLSRAIYDKLPSALKDGKLGGPLCEYVVDHLCTLGEQLMRRGPTINNEDVRVYLNKVFVQRAFLEYEVYSALVRQGIAAIPRLRLSIYDHEHRRHHFYQEVDVVAVVDGEVWLIEVTTRRDDKEIEEKVKRYEELKSNMDADRVVFVCSPSSRKLIEEAFKSAPMGKGLHYVEIGKLCSEVFRILASKSRR